MFRHVERFVAVLCLTAAVVMPAGAQSGSKTLPFKGKISGFNTLISDGSVSGVAYGGGITLMGVAEMVLHSFPAGGHTPYAFLHISKNGSQSPDHVFADLEGTSTDTIDGVVYSGTGTFTSGVGQFEGITGTFSWMAVQTGDFDGNSKPTEFSFNGSMTLPK